MGKQYNCNKCGQEIVFDSSVLGMNGKPRPLNPDHSVHTHIAQPNIVGQKPREEEPIKNEREEYWRKRDEIFEKRFELTQSHWTTIENLLLVQTKELADIGIWLKANSSKGAKEAITELNDKTHNLEKIVELQNKEKEDLKEALAKTSFKSGTEV